MFRNSQAAAHIEQTESDDAGTSLGRLIGLVNGEPLVEIDGQRHRARTCVRLDATMLNQEVVVARPNFGGVVILGVLQAEPASQSTGAAKDAAGIVTSPLGVEIDGDQLVLSAKTRITLRCGEAMLILDETGRVTIRGKTVVSHASGVNRIRGGAIQLN